MNESQLDLVLEYLNTGILNESLFDKFKKKKSQTSKEVPLNDIEKNFLKESYSYLEEIFNNLKKSSKYKNKKFVESLKITKDNKATATEINIAWVSVDFENYDEDETYDLENFAEMFFKNMKNEVNKKYKNIEGDSYSYAEGWLGYFCIKRNKISEK
jgi:hypothetical protein